MAEVDLAHAVRCELACESLSQWGTLQLDARGLSMIPTIWPGDRLILTKLNSCEIALGDIGLYQRDGRLFIHRVIAINGSGDDGEIVLKGDSLTEADPAIPNCQVLGRVQCIVRNGQKIEPARALRRPQRVIAALVQGSSIGTRIVFGMRNAYLGLKSSMRQN